MTLLRTFKIPKKREYEETEIIKLLVENQEDNVRSVIHWLQEHFYKVWKQCIRKDWDVDNAWQAFEYSIVTFVRRVQEDRYTENNWIGFCRVIAERRYFQLKGRQKRTFNLEDASIPEPIVWEDADCFLPLLPLFNEIEWEREDYHISTIAEWYNDGFSWGDIRKKLEEKNIENINEASLRQQWARALGDIRKLLIFKNWPNLVGSARFCHAFCKGFVELRLNGIRANQIKKEHPQLVSEIVNNSNEDNFSIALEKQFSVCTACLIKKIDR